MGVTGFDRAKSNRVDSTVDDDRKSHKNNTRKRRSIRTCRLRHAEVRNTEKQKLEKGHSCPFFMDISPRL